MDHARKQRVHSPRFVRKARSPIISLHSPRERVPVPQRMASPTYIPLQTIRKQTVLQKQTDNHETNCLSKIFPNTSTTFNEKNEKNLKQKLESTLTQDPENEEAEEKYCEDSFFLDLDQISSYSLGGEQKKILEYERKIEEQKSLIEEQSSLILLQDHHIREVKLREKKLKEELQREKIEGMISKRRKEENEEEILRLRRILLEKAKLNEQSFSFDISIE